MCSLCVYVCVHISLWICTRESVQPLKVQQSKCTFLCAKRLHIFVHRVHFHIKIYPLIIKRGWLGNVRTKWRYLNITKLYNCVCIYI